MTYDFKQESNEVTSSTSVSTSVLSVGKLTPTTNLLLPIEAVVGSDNKSTASSSDVKPDSVRLLKVANYI